jgi:hypothetical protein
LIFVNGFGLNGTFLLAGGNNSFVLTGHAMSDPNLVGVNEQVLAYFEAGQTPIYRIAFHTVRDTGDLSSVITGYLVDLTQ